MFRSAPLFERPRTGCSGHPQTEQGAQMAVKTIVPPSQSHENTCTTVYGRNVQVVHKVRIKGPPQLRRHGSTRRKARGTAARNERTNEQTWPCSRPSATVFSFPPSRSPPPRGWCRAALETCCLPRQSPVLCGGTRLWRDTFVCIHCTECIYVHPYLHRSTKLEQLSWIETPTILGEANFFRQRNN